MADTIVENTANISLFGAVFPCTILSLISFLSFPLILKSGLGLKKNYNSVDDLVPFMSSSLKFSRITGILFALSFLISF